MNIDDLKEERNPIEQLSILAEQQESACEHVNNQVSDKFILSRKNTSLDQYVNTVKSSTAFTLQRRNQSIVEEEDGVEGEGEVFF